MSVRHCPHECLQIASNPHNCSEDLLFPLYNTLLRRTSASRRVAPSGGSGQRRAKRKASTCAFASSSSFGPMGVRNLSLRRSKASWRNRELAGCAFRSLRSESVLGVLVDAPMAFGVRCACGTPTVALSVLLGQDDWLRVPTALSPASSRHAARTSTTCPRLPWQRPGRSWCAIASRHRGTFPKENAKELGSYMLHVLLYSRFKP